MQGASWIVNLCADADDYRDALIGLDDAFGETLPIFNHPRAVARSRRDLSAKLLEGVAGLAVPKCIRLTASEQGCFEKTFAAEGFHYPVLIRPAGSQTARGLVRVDHPFDWPKVYQSHWYGRPYYMTQFVDCRRADGQFLKVRFCFVGDQVSLRGHALGKDWLVTATRQPTKEIVERFFEHRRAFPQWRAAQSVAHEIRQRVGLDFFGVDLGVLDDDTFVLFEANAAMTMAVSSTVTGEMRNLMKPIYSELSVQLQQAFDALKSRVARPPTRQSVAEILT